MNLFDKLFIKNIRTVVTPSPDLMPEDKFWQIIQSSHNQAKGNFVSQQEVLRHFLQNLDPKEIMHFDNRFRSLRGEAYDWGLWGAIYTIHGGCFEDSFSDFRGWLIAQGKEQYYKALKNPESLVDLDPSVIDIDWEGMNSIAAAVFKEVTGQKLSSGFVENKKLTGEEWIEFTDDLKNRFPKLWAKYNKAKK